jgi:tRNA threonylcarbamoyl adenosine modification protein YeaZ
MRVLAIASAAGGCSAAIVQGETVLARAHTDAARGLPERIAGMVADLVAQAGAPELVAVVVGPGSFTGLRAGIAVAQGAAIGAGAAVVGVSVREALEAALPHLGGRYLWVATHARTGRIFLDRDGTPEATALTEIPHTKQRIAVAGDALIPDTATLAAREVDVMLTTARFPSARLVALIGARRAAGRLPPLAATPLYIDAPEAKLPAGGLRPAPACPGGAPDAAT